MVKLRIKKILPLVLSLTLILVFSSCNKTSDIAGSSVELTTETELTIISETITQSENTTIGYESDQSDFINYGENKIYFDTEEEYLKYTNIEDFHNLSYLKNLKVLSIDFQNTYDNIDLSVLADLNNLEELYLYNSYYIEGIDSLSNLTKMKYLSFYSINIENIDFVANFKNLELIFIENLPIISIEPLKNCIQLNMLSVKGSEIRDISSLKDLRGLTYLAIDSSKITDISVISSFPKLEHLSLYDNFISDINDVKFPSSLKRLDLSYNNIDNYTSIYSLTNLEELSLDGCDICNGDFLASMGSAKILNLLSLKDNTFANLSFVQYLPALETFLFDYNNVKDLTPLYKIDGLEYISISGNPITDLTQLEGVNRSNIPSGRIAVFVFDIPLTEAELNFFFENNEYAYRALPE